MRYLTTALLVLWCGSQERTITAQGGTPDRLVGKVWVATDPSAAPGTIRIFLADGTLVMDSCGETYRLSEWKRIDDRHVEWTEDGVSIFAADMTGPGSTRSCSGKAGRLTCSRTSTVHCSSTCGTSSCSQWLSAVHGNRSSARRTIGLRDGAATRPV